MLSLSVGPLIEDLGQPIQMQDDFIIAFFMYSNGDTTLLTQRHAQYLCSLLIMIPS